MIRSCLKFPRQYFVVIRTCKRLKNFTVVCLDPKGGTKQKIAYGNSLKQYNKENKDLFGDLLETRSDRSKTILQRRADVAPEVVDNSNDNSAEKLWYSKSAGKNSQIKKLQDGVKPSVGSKRQSNECEKPVTNEKHHRSNESNEKEIVQGVTQETVSKSNTLGNISVSNNFESTVEVTNSNLSDKQFKKLILPDVIIRNIPSFPLLNNSKKESIDDEYCDDILKLSLEDHSENKNIVAYPSVTRILQETMSDSARFALQRWKEQMIEKLGEIEFEKFQKDLLSHGAMFHSILQNYLSGVSETDIEIDPKLEGCWESLESVLPMIENVKVVESHVVHSGLMYRGVIDCVAYYKGQPVLIEWKKSDKQKPELQNTYDAPLQMCAYLGALNYDLKYNFQLKQGLVVVAYTDGSPAHVFPVKVADTLKYWRFWLLRLHKYWENRAPLNEEAISLKC